MYIYVPKGVRKKIVLPCAFPASFCFYTNITTYRQKLFVLYYLLYPMAQSLAGVNTTTQTEAHATTQRSYLWAQRDAQGPASHVLDQAQQHAAVAQGVGPGLWWDVHDTRQCMRRAQHALTLCGPHGRKRASTRVDLSWCTSTRIGGGIGGGPCCGGVIEIIQTGYCGYGAAYTRTTTWWK